VEIFVTKTGQQKCYPAIHNNCHDRSVMQNFM